MTQDYRASVRVTIPGHALPAVDIAIEAPIGRDYSSPHNSMALRRQP